MNTDVSLKKYFYHSIINDSTSSLNIIKSILDSGYIMNSSSQGVKVRRGCHNSNEVCLSHYTPLKNNKNYISCFKIYIPLLTTFVIDEDISKKFKMFKPKLVTTDAIFKNKCSSKVTNIYDEYRTKNNIPLEYIKGLSIPYKGLVSDPFLFYLFSTEDALVAYYNGYIPSDMADVIYEEGCNSKQESNRRNYMDDYIERIDSIAKSSEFKLPIFYYEDNRLVLR